MSPSICVRVCALPPLAFVWYHHSYVQVRRVAVGMSSTVGYGCDVVIGVCPVAVGMHGPALPMSAGVSLSLATYVATHVATRVAIHV